MQRSTLRNDTRFRTATPRPVDIGARIVDRRFTDPAAERRALVAGLLDTPATIAPKYFYDAAGCALFCKICNLPEYYPTRTEARIFDREREAIVAAVGTGKEIVDLGAGDCAKAATWLPWLQPTTYVAVDIAADALEQALPKLALAYPAIEMRGVLTDFTCGLDLGSDIVDGPTTFFYPGSSIGNFTPAEALEFLQDVRRHCGTDAESGLLIGVDTKKDPARLCAAYDDGAGVTAAFNRNVLSVLNRELGADFDETRFAHVAVFEKDLAQIEMRLRATESHSVRVRALAIDVAFEAGEEMRTEVSAKFTREQADAELRDAGLHLAHWWTDPDGDFALLLARPLEQASVQAAG